jgi:hypothetical protein
MAAREIQSRPFPAEREGMGYIRITGEGVVSIRSQSFLLLERFGAGSGSLLQLPEAIPLS